MMKRFLRLTIPVLLLCTVNPVAAQQATFTHLPFRAGVVSDSGGLIAVSDHFQYDASLWLVGADSFIPIGNLPGYNQTVVLDVSDVDTVAVGYGRSSLSGRTAAFKWTQETGIEFLCDLPDGTSADYGTDTRATAVADNGVIVGDCPVRYSGIDDEGDEVTDIVRMGNVWNPDGTVDILSFLNYDEDGIPYGSSAKNISSDGSTIVGAVAVDTQSDEVVYWTNLSGPTIMGPWIYDSFSATEVSKDGSVLAGGSSACCSPEDSFVWTTETGFTTIGHLAGGGDRTRVNGMTDDGSVVVGRSEGGASAANTSAFLWTDDSGIQDLNVLLPSEHGIDLTGWSLSNAMAISGDGRTIAGYGRLEGESWAQYWMVTLPKQPLHLLNPSADNLVVARENYPIRWDRADSILGTDLYLLPDTLGADSMYVGTTFEVDSLVWAVPDSLFSRSARIVVVDVLDPEVADTSDYFRIKPYHLARISDDSTRYVPFEVQKHGWSFKNTQLPLFPAFWYLQDQFLYAAGIDPFSEDEYDSDFPDAPISAAPMVFPDWPAYTRAFGTDAAFWYIIPGIEAFYKDSFTAKWGAQHGGTGWNGSCSGMAISSLLAFGHREAFGDTYPDIGPVEQLVSVLSSDATRETVNTLFSYWRGQTQKQYRASLGISTYTPRQVLADLKARLLADHRMDDGYLYIRNVGGSGAHAVTPYRIIDDPGNPNRKWVYIYDPNFAGDDDKYVVIDSTANTWFYTDIGKAGWGGPSGMYMMDPISNYLHEAIPAQNVASVNNDRIPASKSHVASSLYLAATPGARITLTGASGASIGYADSIAFNTIEGARLNLPPVGGFTPPIGYTVPTGAYTLDLAGAPDSLVSATLFNTDRIYSYGRQDASGDQVDHLTFDPAANNDAGEITVRSEDVGASKLITLRAIVSSNPAIERTLDVRRLTLTGADSIRFAATGDGTGDGQQLRVQNQGGDKTYSLRLREASTEKAPKFESHNIPLAGGATHTVRPTWATLAEGTVIIDIDLDGDGSTDETLELVNTVANDPVPGEGAAPVAFELHAAYPNPFSQRTTIHFEVPRAGPIRMTVYDLMGREVAILVDKVYPAGGFEVSFDGQHLPSGLYFYRMDAGDVTKTNTMILVR